MCADAAVGAGAGRDDRDAWPILSPYQLTCSDGRALADIPVVFGVLRDDGSVAREIPAVADAAGAVPLTVNAEDFPPPWSPVLRIGVTKIGSQQVCDSAPFTLQIKGHLPTLGYAVGTGVDAGFAVLSAGQKVGLGLKEVGEKLTITRRIGSKVGAGTPSFFKGVAGKIAPIGLSADASLEGFFHDSFAFDDYEHDPQQREALAALIFDTLVTYYGPQPASFLLGQLLEPPGGVDGYRESTGNGAGVSVEVGAQAHGTVSLLPFLSGVTPAAVQIELAGEGGVSGEYLFSLYEQDAEVRHQVAIDAAINYAAAISTVSAGLLHDDLEGLTIETNGLGGSIMATAVFDPAMETLQRISVELSGVRRWGTRGSMALKVAAGLNARDDNSSTDAIEMTFEGAAAKTLAENVGDALLDTLAGLAELPLSLGPTKAGLDLEQWLEVAQGLPYRYEKRRTIGEGHSAGLTIPVLGLFSLTPNVNWDSTLTETIRRGLGGSQGLVETESYGNGIYGRDDLPPSLETLVGDLITDVVHEIVPPPISIGDGEITIGGQTIPIIPWHPWGFLSGLSARRGLPILEPHLGVGGYHFFSPLGLILGPNAAGSARSEDGSAELTVNAAGGILRLAYSPTEVASSWETQLRILEWRGDESRWVVVGGTVDTVAHTVSAPITTLGLFTLGPVLPSGVITWSLPAAIAPGATATFTASVVGTDERAVPNGTLVTVNALDALAMPPEPTGTILDLDAAPAIDGLQVATRGGKATLHYRAPALPDTVLVTAASVLGDAKGQGRVSFGNAGDRIGAAPSLVSVLRLRKGRLTVPRVAGSRGKYSLQAEVQFASTESPALSGGDVDLTISDGIGSVDQHVVQGLQAQSDGRTWKYKNHYTRSGIAKVTVATSSTGYIVSIRGSGDLSALYGSDVTLTLGLGGAEARAQARLRPLLRGNGVVLRFP